MGKEIRRKMRRGGGNTLTERYMGNMPVGVKYEIVGTDYRGKYGGMIYTTCDNCGRVITNVYFLKAENSDKIYSVGSECVKPLVGESYNLSEHKRLLSRKISFIKMMNTKVKSITLHNYGNREGKYFRVYGFVTNKWDVNALGTGDYEYMKKYIDMLNIPITDCSDN